MTSPPDAMIARAVAAATLSPCAKSKRGAVVYYPKAALVLGEGHNGQPDPFLCRDSAGCRESCAKLCVHAESRAIAAAIASATKLRAKPPVLAETHLLHAKVVDGQLVTSGGPSCWQCSRDVVEHKIDGVWLYEDDGSRFYGWRFYTAIQFHAATLDACGLAYAHRNAP
jgi:deoxycytidylate deaminase